MIHRVALFAGSLVAALTLAVGLVVAGVTPGAGPAAAEPVVPAAATADIPAPGPTFQVDLVYVAPPVAPQEVTVTQPATASRRGDDDGEHERGGDD